MVDACTIAAHATRGALNTTTGQYPSVAGALIYSGPCRVKSQGEGNVAEAGEQAVSLWPFQVSVPVSVTDVGVDHVVTITASALDPALVGTELRVRHVTKGSHITARRLACEVNAG